MKRIVRETAWLDGARGKAVKIVVPLIQHLPADRAYKILYLDRSLDEVLASQAAMLERLGKPRTQVGAEALAEVFSRQAARCQEILTALPQADCLLVRHRDALTAPGETAARIADFLGASAGLDVGRMSAAIQPRLYRARKAGAREEVTPV